MVVSRLALFPLGTVLVPTAVLPLHVFEPRYRQLMADLGGPGGSPEGAELGIVLITRGSEVGGGESREAVGTCARVAEAARLADGRWLIAVVGEARFEVTTWLPDDPYPLAEVRSLEEPPWDGDPGLLADTERRVRRCLALVAESGGSAAPVTFGLDAEPRWATWQLSAVAPVSVVDRQQLLETASHRCRLVRVAQMVDEVSEILALRLGEAE